MGGLVKSTMSEAEGLFLDVELRKAKRYFEETSGEYACIPDIEEARHRVTFDSLVETRACADYEASRKRVAGRPAWDRLNPHDPYDMGMRQIALDRARGEIINEVGK
jgi:hypothetical protein